METKQTKKEQKTNKERENVEWNYFGYNPNEPREGRDTIYKKDKI